MKTFLTVYITLAVLTGISFGAEPVGYLMPGDGAPTVTRQGEPVELTGATLLMTGDSLELPSEATAYVVTPDGARQLKGPVKIESMARSELVPQSTATSPQPSATRGETGTRGIASSLLETTLFQSREIVMESVAVTPMRAGEAINILSPRGVTAWTNPVISWEAGPEKLFDVRIRKVMDRAGSEWVITEVSPPVRFQRFENSATLEPDEIYELRITERGRPLAVQVSNFLTARSASQVLEATNERDILISAVDALTGSPLRPGDALGLLSLLQDDSIENDLAWRLQFTAKAMLQ